MLLGLCILCSQECDEDRSKMTGEAWTNLKHHAQNWVELDQYGIDTVKWDNGPDGIFFHQTCKLNLSSQRKLNLALNRKSKLEA